MQDVGGVEWLRRRRLLSDNSPRQGLQHGGVRDITYRLDARVVSRQLLML